MGLKVPDNKCIVKKHSPWTVWKRENMKMQILKKNICIKQFEIHVLKVWDTVVHYIEIGLYQDHDYLCLEYWGSLYWG
jgi:hypothetical protein